MSGDDDDDGAADRRIVTGSPVAGNPETHRGHSLINSLHSPLFFRRYSCIPGWRVQRPDSSINCCCCFCCCCCC
jgi:hypothetical protein